MNRSFQLSCESTVDVPYSHVNSRGIPVLFYSYTVNGIEHTDDMGRDPAALPEFYSLLEAGSIPTTSQLNEFSYLDFFRSLLEQGDLMHIAFGTGMTASYLNAVRAAEQLREEFPQRRIVVIDSLCSSSGYGMLVDYAADLRDLGRSMDETAEWVIAHRQKLHHQFYSTDLKYYRRSGRISGAEAAVGAILNICPIMRLDDGGHIIAYSKVRGKKAALRTTLDEMEKHAEGGAAYSGKCWVCHSNCPEEAAALKSALEGRFPNISGPVMICDIGTIIAAHCGPGTVAVFFIGDERLPDRH